ncbi:reverse transcriptase domain-containing protein [Tanacetum coccineum]
MVDILQVIESRNPTVGGPYHRIHKQGHAPLEQKEAREYAHGGGGTIVLSEIHAGSCSMHSGPRSVVARALRSGYYWPTMHRDVRDMIRKCHDCQHRRIEILIVAIDYFTKWIEARAVATITGNQVKRFVWDNIVCRFGLPGEIVSDNGKQFCDNPFKDCLLAKGITSTPWIGHKEMGRGIVTCPVGASHNNQR